MTHVPSELVKRLRHMTDAPIMECKRALAKTNGNIEEAIDTLRLNDIDMAEGLSDRTTSNGALGLHVSMDGLRGAIVYVTCETDFVARTPRFTGFVDHVAKIIANAGPDDVDALMTCQYDDRTVAEALTRMIHILGENMRITDFVRLSEPQGLIGAYLHHDRTLASLVDVSVADAKYEALPGLKDYVHDLALQVTATNPLCVYRENAPTKTMRAEYSIATSLAAESKKPKDIQRLMVDGRVEKFYRTVVLYEQTFVKDDSTTIEQRTKALERIMGCRIVITSFVRFEAPDKITRSC